MNISKQNNLYHVLASRDELRTIGQCLLEARENLSDEEFEARVGEPKSEAKLLLEQIVKAFRDL